jgi:hypothetical protein
VQPAQPSRPHRVAHGLIPGVESALEPDLQRRSGRLDLLEHRDRAGDVAGDGLLAEHRQTRAGQHQDQVGMGRCRGRNDRGVDSSLHRGRRVLGRRGTNAVADLSRPGPVAVCDDDFVDLREIGQVGRVEGADASSTDHADPHGAPPSGHAAA